jgi:hypothetical protein
MSDRLSGIYPVKSQRTSKKRSPDVENAFHILILKRVYRGLTSTGLNLYRYTGFNEFLGSYFIIKMDFILAKPIILSTKLLKAMGST